MGFDVLGLGSFVGSNKVSNKTLGEKLNKDEDWIFSRSGIKSRNYACEFENIPIMAKEAAMQAIKNAGIRKEDIKILIVATFSSEMLTPSVACVLQKELELEEDIFAFDINAACSGFVYALKLAGSLLSQCENAYALVVGAELISRLLEEKSVGTGILFGDAAAAAVLGNNDLKKDYFYMGCRGNTEILSCAGVNRKGEKSEIHMQGQEVLRFAVNIVPHCIEKVLLQASLTDADIKYYVFHQANARIIRSVQKKMNIAEEKIAMNIENNGNTSAASIGILLDDMNKKDMLKKGDKLVLVGFGSGLSWGAGLIVW